MPPPQSKRPKRVFRKKDYASPDGMLTAVWGPSMWHFLHIMSFNYPVEPTAKNKRDYRAFILNLRNTLPCKYCRDNLTQNLINRPLTVADMASRDTFSRYVYQLHEAVNTLLGKKSGLSYCDVRERYEHFRSRCTEDDPALFPVAKTPPGETEKGCTEPLYGKKSKCVIKIVPQDEPCPTLEISEKCIKRR